MQFMAWPMLVVAMGGNAIFLPSAIGNRASRLPCSSAVQVTPMELATHPEHYYKETVCLRGSVSEVLNPNLFSISNDDAHPHASDVLVLMPATSSTITDRTEVTVIGMVRAFTRAEADEESTPPGAEPDARLTRPVVVAESVRTPSGEELVLQRREFHCC